MKGFDVFLPHATIEKPFLPKFHSPPFCGAADAKLAARWGCSRRRWAYDAGHWVRIGWRRCQIADDCGGRHFVTWRKRTKTTQETTSLCVCECMCVCGHVCELPLGGVQNRRTWPRNAITATLTMCRCFLLFHWPAARWTVRVYVDGCVCVCLCFVSFLHLHFTNILAH